jgi:hypothetical protein
LKNLQKKTRNKSKSRPLLTGGALAVFLALMSVSHLGCFTESTGGSSLDVTSLATAVAIVGADSGETKDVGSVPINVATDIQMIIGNIGPYTATNLTAVSGGSSESSGGEGGGDGGEGGGDAEASTDLTAPFGFKGGTFPGEGGTCGSTLAGNETCIVVLTVTPTEHGSFSETMTIQYFNGVMDFTFDVALSAKTTAVLDLTVASTPITEAAPYVFGVKALNSVNELTIDVTNPGATAATEVAETAAAALAAPFAFKGGTFPGTGGTCTATIEPNVPCTLVLTYSPVDGGDSEDVISLDYNNGATTVASTAKLTGSTPAVLSISDGATYDYGTVSTAGAAAPKTFTLSNAGGAATLIAETIGQALVAPYTFHGGAFVGSGTCTATLPALSTCTFIVNFDPTVVSGVPVTDTLSLSYDNGLGSGAVNATTTRALTGVGGP